MDEDQEFEKQYAEYKAIAIRETIAWVLVVTLLVAIVTVVGITLSK